MPFVVEEVLDEVWLQHYFQIGFQPTCLQSDKDTSAFKPSPLTTIDLKLKEGTAVEGEHVLAY